MKLQATDTSLSSSGGNLNDIIDQAKERFHKLYDLCVAIKVLLNTA